MTVTAARLTPRTTDLLCLAAITVASTLPYVGSLGYYSDDWSLLESFSAARTGSLTALIGDGFAGRPVQGLYLASLFKVFGLHPLGYHLVNMAVLAASACLFYLLLVRLSFRRDQAFATALIFLMLPQLSTVRAWYSTFQIPLSMVFMLISLHCQLTFARSGGLRWLAGAIAAALLSVGAYEIFAPVIVGFAAALSLMEWRKLERTRRRRLGLAVAASLIALLLALAYKLSFSERAGAVGDPQRYLRGLQQLFRLDYDWRVDSSLNIFAMLRTHFWAPVQGWWTGARALLGAGAGLEATALAVLIAALAWWRLRPRTDVDPSFDARRLLLIGIATFILGHVTFLIVPAIVFTSTGMGNRVHVAAALGVAMIFTSLLLAATRAIPVQHRSSAFALIVAAITAAGFVRLATIESYWAKAPALQQQILDAAKSDLRSVPANSTVILDGVCPYYGPAVVFETNWDVGGALTLSLGRPLTGDVVSPRMSAQRGGILTSIYKAPSFYPYGQRLYVYNPAKHLLVRLADAGAASSYFGNREPMTCEGEVARGVEV